MSSTVIERPQVTTPEVETRAILVKPERLPRIGAPFVVAPRRRIPAIAALLGLVGMLVSFAGSWNPSFWGDEAASIMSAERPLGTLWAELSHIDAVHGLYYLFLHFWIDLFGASELAVRLPSAIAVGFVVAGTVVLGTMLFDLRIAIIAGIVCAVLPRVTYMGAEGRSYAIGTALAVWLTVLFLTLLAKRVTRVGPWIGYGLLLALALYLFLYLALIVIVHGATLLAKRNARVLAPRWAIGVGIAALVAAPIIAFGAAQHGQIAFLATRDYTTFTNIFVKQWFGNPWLAAACWALIIAGIAVSIGRRRTESLPVILWLLLPMTLLFAIDKLVVPAYSVRYLSFCTPAVALMIAVAIGALGAQSGRTRWLPVLAVGLVVGLAVPSYLQQRGPFAKDGGSDLRQTAAVLHANAKPGDAVVFDNQVRPSRKPRIGMHLYPTAYAGLKDVTLVTPYTDEAGLWDAVAPVSQVSAQLSGVSTVWALERTPEASSRDVLQLEQLGYANIHTIHIHETTIYEFAKGTS
jgi:mannosyltransferase